MVIRALLALFVALVFLATGCGGGSGNSKPISIGPPGVAAIPHAVFDPSWADRVASRASYGAWVKLVNDHTLDLAVWPSQSAAKDAFRRYQAGGPATRPGADPAWPHVVRQIERVKNVTLAWYRRPTSSDESSVRSALQFSGTRGARDYTSLWVIPNTLIDSDGTAPTAPARFSARLELSPAPGKCGPGLCPGPVGGPLTVAIWPSRDAAKRHIQAYKDVYGSHSKRIRNATIDWQDYEYPNLTPADERAVRAALH